MNVSRRTFYTYWMLLLLLCLCAMNTMGSEQERNITSQQWQELIGDETFKYRTEKELVEMTQPKPRSNYFTRLIEAIFSFFGSPVGKAIVWILLISLLGFALYKVFVNERTGLFAKRKKALPGEEETTDEHEDVLTGNWEHLLHDALKKRDMRMAIRYSYMLMLQLLQQNQLIDYRPDKTNYEYYYELKSPEVKQNFKLLSRQYEFAWYGDYPIAPERFDEYMRSFNQVKDMLHRG